MGNTLVDEPLPSTQSEPPAADRPTLDDPMGLGRPTVDDVPQAMRRGPSPTLVDGPTVPRRAPPTLADGPPPPNYPTPAAAPIFAMPTPQPPAATPAPQAPLESAPVAVRPGALAQQIAPSPPPALAQPGQPPLGAPPVAQPPPPAGPVPVEPPQAAGVPSGPRVASKEMAATQKSEQSPAVAPAPAPGPPPPLAYPARAVPPAGLLAQLPAMPTARPGPSPFAAPAPAPAPAAPALSPLPISTAQQVFISPAPSTSQAPASEHVPVPVESSPILTPARDAIPAPPPVVSPPEIATPAPVAAPAAPVAPPVVIDHTPAPMRLAPGARTLVGVAPSGTPVASAPGAPKGTGQYTPPGQTSAPSPHDPTLPVTSAVEAPRPAGSPGTAGNTDEDAPTGTAGAAAGAPSGAAATPGSQPEARPRSRARTVLAVLFAVVGVLAIAGVTIGYLVFFRYTPLAEHHIPGASNLAIRADVRSIGTFGPVRKHLWPVLFERPSQKESGKTLADRLGDATGIRPAIDAREVIVASVDARSWVLLVGGNFEPGAFVPGLEKVLREEGLPDWQKSGELLIGPGGVAVAQAEDGTLILGTEAEIVTSALPSTEEHKRMDLPKEGALAFAISKEAWEEISRTTAAFDPGGALRRIRHVRGTLTLGDEPSIDVGIEPKGGESAEALGRDVEQLLSLLRLGLVAVPDQMGEKSALSSAKITVEEGRVRVRGAWPLEGLDRGFATLAGKIAAK